MSITILCPSPLIKESSIRTLCDDYIKRINAPVHLIECPAKVKNSDSPDIIRKKQAEAILKHTDKMSHNTITIAMDERGKPLSSPELAKQWQTWNNNGYSSLCFIIGGAYGLPQEVLEKVDFKLSFGAMVWPHRLVGVMVLEQLYRAQQINAGHPYHKA